MKALRELARERTPADAPAHDFSHVLRVEENARRIAAVEGGRLEVVVPAALLHELFSYPKDSPESHRSGEVCAALAREALEELVRGPSGFAATPDQIEAVTLCIREHPFSLARIPASLEGRVLQDADRLDAIGAVGIARCFATCGELRRPLFHPEDPFCVRRAPDDKNYGLDHFYRKLLQVAEGLHTATARALAEERTRFLRAYLEQLAGELSAGVPVARGERA